MKDGHAVVSPDDWLRARTEFLAKEKEFTHARDELNRQRRELPWEPVQKEYRFEGPDGEETLADLFDGRSQLIVYHFMFGPEWDAGCPNCSFWADNFNGIPVHLNRRDVSFVAVSRAPLDKLAAYQKRMGWDFKWVSSFHSDFNRDFYVGFTTEEVAQQSGFYNYRMQDPNDEEREGISVFYQDDDGQVFHTYSAYARGIDMMNGAYHFLDLVPKGRDETGHVPPPYWVRRHDEY
jgi:predicted dithiol-disulfide oxidoreductase (DUF899 family)